MTNVHARLMPSSSGRWVTCPGSVNLEASVTNEEGPEAREGHAAHSVVSRALQRLDVPPEGEVAPNGVPIDHDMIEGALLYATHIFETAPQGSELHIEEYVDCSIIHAECGGTPDAYTWSPYQLDVWDYKYGHGFVDAFENWQLICYAAGLLAKLNGLVDQQVRVRLHIIQPRNYDRSGPVRTWEIQASDLRPYINMLQASAAAALSPNAKTVSSPEACRYCRARHICSALQQMAASVVQMAGDTVPLDLKPGALGRELRELKRGQAMLDARVEALEEQAIAAIRQGQNVPFWQLGASRARMEWAKPADEVIALGHMLGVELAKPVEPITPMQAKKLGIDESVINEYAHRPPGSVKLQPVDISTAKKVFSK